MPTWSTTRRSAAPSPGMRVTTGHPAVQETLHQLFDSAAAGSIAQASDLYVDPTHSIKKTNDSCPSCSSDVLSRSGWRARQREEHVVRLSPYKMRLDSAIWIPTASDHRSGSQSWLLPPSIAAEASFGMHDRSAGASILFEQKHQRWRTSVECEDSVSLPARGSMQIIAKRHASELQKRVDMLFT